MACDFGVRLGLGLLVGSIPNPIWRSLAHKLRDAIVWLATGAAGLGLQVAA